MAVRNRSGGTGAMYPGCFLSSGSVESVKVMTLTCRVVSTVFSPSSVGSHVSVTSTEDMSTVACRFDTLCRSMSATSTHFWIACPIACSTILLCFP